MAKKVFPQGYPRIQDEGDRFYGFLNDKALEEHEYKIDESKLKEIIAAAIQNANKKVSRAILEIPENAVEEEIQKMKKKIQIYLGDSREVLKKFPDGFFSLIVTSPPYADARDKHYESIKPEDYPDFFLSFHDEFWRVLADDGSFVLNIKDKVVNGVRNRYVWETIMALSNEGWLCIDDYLWVKPNAMPGFWPNRLRDEWEYCFHMTKQKKFKIYQEAVKKPIGRWVEKRLVNLNGKSAERHNSENDSGFGRDLRNWENKENVLPGNTISVPLVGKNMGHPAVFPVGLPEFFIKLFSKEDDNVLDPFAGSGSTGIAAAKLNRNVVLIDCEKEYFNVMKKRLGRYSPLFMEAETFEEVAL